MASIGDSLAQAYEGFKVVEANFKLADVWDWHASHVEVPVFCCCIYFVVVFWLPGVLAEHDVRFNLRRQMIMWNLLLAGFSTFGASRTVPHLLKGLREQGFEGTVCNDGAWFLNGTSGFWVMLFIYSKMPELVDTLFLVLKRRPVILLHWFHHCTVLLFCWHGYHTKAGPGMWFATMNFCVHSIMYFYYAMMATRWCKGLLNAIAPLITLLQILQMVGGMVVVVTAVRKLNRDGVCDADPSNLKLGFAMYASYFVLFFMLFWSKYVNKPCKGKQSPDSDPTSSNMLCGVDLRSTDTAGHFNNQFNSKEPSSPPVSGTSGKKKEGKKSK